MPEPMQSPADNGNQLSLFPNGEPPIPDDLMQDLSIVTGAFNPLESEGQEPLSRLHPDFKGTKYELLKKSDRVQKLVHYEDAHMKVIDIATPEGEEEMAQVLKKVGNPENGMGFSETPPQTMLDPTTPRGFRTIVVVRWWKARTIVKPVGAEATTIQALQANAPKA